MAKKNILVIDDNDDVLLVIKDVLEYADFDVRALQCANKLFDIITEFKPDIILMDYILNGINGGEICHQIKTDPRTCHLPVVLISAYPKVLKSLGDYGCDAFISKPFDMQELLDCINTCLA